MWRLSARVEWAPKDGRTAVQIVRLLLKGKDEDRPVHVSVERALKRVVAPTARFHRTSTSTAVALGVEPPPEGSPLWEVRGPVLRRAARGVGVARESFYYEDGTAEVRVVAGWDEDFDTPPCDCMDCSINGEPTH